MNPIYTEWPAAPNLPKQAGKNLGKERGKEILIGGGAGESQKDKAGRKDRVPVTASPDDKHSGYTLVSVRDTSAITCYGCGGKVHTKRSDNPPPPPFGIFVIDMNAGYSKREVT